MTRAVRSVVSPSARGKSLQISDTKPDGDLLAQFIAGRDASAFAELVRRHGPMVLRVCRRVLGNSHDAEDAFQATFLVLVKKASLIGRRDLLGNWLYGVAYRVALQVRQDVASARAHDQSTDPASVAERDAPTADAGWRELRPVLDAEVQRLPEKYRAPVILCYLQGKTNEEAAQQLAWPTGTVKIRLSRAREMLRQRLTRRGVALSAGTLALLAGEATAATLPVTLAQTTIEAAALMGAEKAAGGVLSAKAVALADAAVKGGALLKAKLFAAGAVAVLATTVAVVALMRSDAVPPAMVLADFNGATIPVNQAGEPYPSYYFQPQEPGDPGGIFTASLNERVAIKGKSLQLRLTQGLLKAQFNPYSNDRRGFAREYVGDPAAWHFNTYNQLTFWLKLPMPAEGQPYRSNGEASVTVGTYCKRIANAHEGNDDSGGGHYYHRVNVPATGHWTQVVLNMHPHMQDGKDLGQEIGIQAHPSGEEGYNYFDTLTRFYIGVRSPPASYPADYLLDEISFQYQPHPENDRQVYAIAATHMPPTNRLILSWSRPKDEDDVKHEVRYAFADIHKIGWDKAEPAPRGLIAPSGSGAFNGMVYDTMELPLAEQSVVYVAIKPQNAALFSQIAVPLTLK
ncbi:hypothetical protein AYO44_05770 [Planctomycetaceae bacterium SCGC AG-212-F19]|nr:hypothetical protein AYO44_05770 [Planctomycetaceae bacterium SCGC AG-212-F19]